MISFISRENLNSLGEGQCPDKISEMANFTKII